MGTFATKHLSPTREAVAPDGMDVRILLGLSAGGMAHFRLAPGEASVAVRHRTVEELWYVVAGQGELWRAGASGEEVTSLEPGVCIAIPLGTRFQTRCTGPDALEVVGCTMPPWPGDGEAIATGGRWAPTLQPGPGLTPG